MPGEHNFEQQLHFGSQLHSAYHRTAEPNAQTCAEIKETGIHPRPEGRGLLPENRIKINYSSDFERYGVQGGYSLTIPTRLDVEDVEVEHEFVWDHRLLDRVEEDQQRIQQQAVIAILWDLFNLAEVADFAIEGVSFRGLVTGLRWRSSTGDSLAVKVTWKVLSRCLPSGEPDSQLMITGDTRKTLATGLRLLK